MAAVRHFFPLLFSLQPFPLPSAPPPLRSHITKAKIASGRGRSVDVGKSRGSSNRSLARSVFWSVQNKHATFSFHVEEAREGGREGGKEGGLMEEIIGSNACLQIILMLTC